MGGKEETWDEGKAGKRCGRTERAPGKDYIGEGRKGYVRRNEGV